MASKVIIPLPTSTAATYQNITTMQSNLELADFVRAPTTNDNLTPSTTATSINKNRDALSRIDQLDKTVKFLKDEQKNMLRSLHQEIATLQSRNRDLLCQLIFKSEDDFQDQNSITDNDVKYILMTNENVKKHKQQMIRETENNDRSSPMNTIYELKYTIDQQCREIEYLKGQLELVSVRNKNQNHESRQTDNYIRELEERSRDQDRLIRLLRKENKEHKIEMENLRKTLSNLRINTHVSPNMQITHVQPQAQLFPAIGTPASTFWYHNRAIPITEYHQLQRNSICVTGGDRTAAGNLPHVQFSLPPVCNYGQMAVSAPLPRYYHNTTASTNANSNAVTVGCYYGVGQRPAPRAKSYTALAIGETGIRCGNRHHQHITNGSNA